MEKDWYDELSDENKASIKCGLSDIANGNVMGNDQAISMIKAKIQSLKK